MYFPRKVDLGIRFYERIPIECTDKVDHVFVPVPTVDLLFLL